MMKDFYSIKEFALLIGVSERTVHRMVKSGRLNAFRVGSSKGSYRIPHTEINRLAMENYQLKQGDEQC